MQRKTFITVALAGALLSAPAFADSAGNALSLAARPGETEMYYVDSELKPGPRVSASSDNAILRDLRRAAEAFDADWGDLPQSTLSEGETLRVGDRSVRVAQLRQRLGLSAGTSFDAELAARVRDYRKAHGLPPAAVVDAEMIRALNRGHDYYKRKIDLNIERLEAIPADPGERYIVVDSAAQILTMYEDGKPVGTMRVVVGKETDPTPMMAGLIRYSEVRPYWNVPPDLVRRNIAPKVLAQGLPYIERTGFQPLSDWTEEAEPLDPKKVDWQAVADGDFDLRVRQLPGPGNGMGDIKFMFPNPLGIYLHDTPSRELFTEDMRAFSAGCVRLQDAPRLARWLHDGEKPGEGSDEASLMVPLPKPVPVFITYLTAAPVDGRIEFRDDFYGRDARLMSRVTADFLDF